jgi:hypothetical protein
MLTHVVMKQLPALPCYVFESCFDGYQKRLVLSCLRAIVYAKVPRACQKNGLLLLLSVMQKHSAMRKAWLLLDSRIGIADCLEPHAAAELLMGGLALYRSMPLMAGQ